MCRAWRFTDPKLTSNLRSGFWLATAVLTFASSLAYSQLPWSTTQPAGPIAASSATLNGMATARGTPAAAWFEWGMDTNYGFMTALTNIGSSGKVVRVSSPVDPLVPGATYHYRLVVTNGFGTALGADTIFTTGTRVTTWIDSSVPLPSIPPGLTNIVGLASGHGHSLAISADGSVIAWGVAISAYYPNDGQTNVPAGLSNVIAVAGGWAHSLALRQDGTVSAWGEYMSPSQPAFVPAGLSNVIAIAGGDSHSVALKNDGTVVAWGGNGQGQTSVPARLTNVVAITAGSTHNLALKADGTVVAWGSETGFPTTPPSGLSNVVAIASETWHNLALRSDGTVVAWGNNNLGQANVPPGLSNVLAITAGFQHSLALKSDGTLVAWGNPRYVTNVPAALGGVAAISSGDYHSTALSALNLGPRAFSRTAVGPVNTDLVVIVAGWDPNGDVLGFRILSPPTNGNLYQYTPSGRGDPITTPNTPLTDSSRALFSPSQDQFGAPYTTFAFVANDGQYDSASALVTVNILLPPVIETASFGASSNQGFSLGFSGFSNASYAVLASTNLVNWTRLGQATQPFPGQFMFQDPATTNWPMRFYRVTSP